MPDTSNPRAAKYRQTSDPISPFDPVTSTLRLPEIAAIKPPTDWPADVADGTQEFQPSFVDCRLSFGRFQSLSLS
jgi:hypothetical protein